MGRSGKIQKSQGTSTPNNLLVIANIIYDLKVQNNLETGMASAASTLAFLAAETGRMPSHRQAYSR